MSLPAGTRLGPYEILSLLAAGGMGTVYRARDTRLQRDVAVKVLPDEFARDPDRLARFEREAQAVAALNHPNILAIHDVGSAREPGADTLPYIVTELLDGESLRARLERGPLPVRKAIDTAIQVARGLAAAHDKGLVHRDLKPDNIFLLADGQVKILDFGLARATTSASEASATIAPITEAGTTLGTVGYMAPEQVRGSGFVPPLRPVADCRSSGRPAHRRRRGGRLVRARHAVDAGFLRRENVGSRVDSFARLNAHSIH